MSSATSCSAKMGMSDLIWRRSIYSVAVIWACRPIMTCAKLSALKEPRIFPTLLPMRPSPKLSPVSMIVWMISMPGLVDCQRIPPAVACWVSCSRPSSPTSLSAFATAIPFGARIPPCHKRKLMPSGTRASPILSSGTAISTRSRTMPCSPMRGLAAMMARISSKAERRVTCSLALMAMIRLSAAPAMTSLKAARATTSSSLTISSGRI